MQHFAAANYRLAQTRNFPQEYRDILFRVGAVIILQNCNLIQIALVREYHETLSSKTFMIKDFNKYASITCYSC